MCLVHEQPIHTKLFKGYDIILTALIIKFIKPCHKLLLGFFHLFYGISFAPVRFCLCYGFRDLIYLPLQNRHLSFL